MTRIKQKDLNKILKQHKLWLDSEGKKGQRANLEGANLEGADLEDAILAQANLKGANLRNTNLAGAELIYAKLTNADLTKADLYAADLYKADLTRANLQQSNLHRAYLAQAILTEINLEGAALTDCIITNQPTPFVLGKQLIMECTHCYKQQVKEGCLWNEIKVSKDLIKLTDLTKALFL